MEMEMGAHQIEIQIMSWQNKNHAQSIIKSMERKCKLAV